MFPITCNINEDRKGKKKNVKGDEVIHYMDYILISLLQLIAQFKNGGHMDL